MQNRLLNGIKMKLKLVREIFNTSSTLGSLYVDNKFYCYTLEDVTREEKVKGETAIWYGIYRIDLTYSPRFGAILPEVMNVRDFSGIRFHAGNTEKDTEGCILLGKYRKKYSIFDSRDISKQFNEMIINAIIDKNEVYLEITK